MRNFRARLTYPSPLLGRKAKRTFAIAPVLGGAGDAVVPAPFAGPFFYPLESRVDGPAETIIL